MTGRWGREAGLWCSAMCLLALLGCGDEKKEAEAATETTEVADAGAEEAETAAPEAKKKAVPTPTSSDIEAEIVSLKVTRGGNASRLDRPLVYVSLVVDATHTAPYFISEPNLRGTIAYASPPAAQEKAFVHPSTGWRYKVPATLSQTSNDYVPDRGAESPWRSHERLRIGHTVSIGSLLLLEGGELDLTISDLRICGTLLGQEVCSKPLSHSIPGDVAIGRVPPEGEGGLYVRGNDKLIEDRGRLRWVSRTAKGVLSVTTPGEELPVAAPAVELASGAVIGSVQPGTVVFAHEKPTELSKGTKVVSFEVQLTPAIAERQLALRGEITAANDSRVAADQALEQAESGLKMASAAEPKDEAAVSKAKEERAAAKAAARNATKAASTTTRAATRELANLERSVSKAIDCQGFELFVDDALVRPRNRKALSCKALAAGETVTLRLEFQLRRHAIPYLLAVKGAAGRRFVPIASKTTTAISGRD